LAPRAVVLTARTMPLPAILANGAYILHNAAGHLCGLAIDIEDIDARKYPKTSEGSSTEPSETTEKPMFQTVLRAGSQVIRERMSVMGNSEYKHAKKEDTSAAILFKFTAKAVSLACMPILLRP